MKEIKSIIYETVDGTLFTDKKEAEKHEKRLLGRRFFRVYAHPDLTEGRHEFVKIMLKRGVSYIYVQENILLLLVPFIGAVHFIIGKLNKSQNSILLI